MQRSLSIVTVGSILTCLLNGSTTFASCTQKMSAQAEVAIENVGTWQQFNDFYRKFGIGCDESESIPSKLEILFTTQWASLTEFARLAKDHNFKAFVLNHIDSTISNPKAIEDLAASKCPSQLSQLCKDIETAARRASQAD